MGEMGLARRQYRESHQMPGCRAMSGHTVWHWGGGGFAVCISCRLLITWYMGWLGTRGNSRGSNMKTMLDNGMCKILGLTVGGGGGGGNEQHDDMADD